MCPTCITITKFLQTTELTEMSTFQTVRLSPKAYPKGTPLEYFMVIPCTQLYRMLLSAVQLSNFIILHQSKRGSDFKGSSPGVLFASNLGYPSKKTTSMVAAKQQNANSGIDSFFESRFQVVKLPGILVTTFCLITIL